MKIWLLAFALGSLVLAAPSAQEHDHSAATAAKPAAAAEHPPDVFCATMKTRRNGSKLLPSGRAG